MEEEFKTYLESKKINSKNFKEVEPERFKEWLNIFIQTNEKSFTSQKLFLINKIRRRYKLEGQ